MSCRRSFWERLGYRPPRPSELELMRRLELEDGLPEGTYSVAILMQQPRALSAVATDLELSLEHVTRCYWALRQLGCPLTRPTTDQELANG